MCVIYGTMPSIQNFTVIYDKLNEDGTFSEGDILTGKVSMVVLKQTTVEYLSVKAKGDANVRWSRKQGEHTHTYSAHRRFFKLKEFLIPEGSKGNAGYATRPVSHACLNPLMLVTVHSCLSPFFSRLILV